ncbi:partitioning defective protein 6 [Arctopsyche grandis]|uniref:partitioning defective protein 6 n=1 Tax=Arctopsyche grandis TaxID=121162 RepID=UPI00406D846D
MSKNKIAARIDSHCVEVKSKFDAEFRRFSIARAEIPKYEEFRSFVERLHGIVGIAFLVSYTDPRDGDLLPINNDDNLGRALHTARPLLRVIIQRKGDSLEELNGYGTMRPRNIISSILGGTPGKTKSLAISNPHDFRQVSAIIDVDIVPETCRRVRLLKHGSDKPLGFYIRDGTSVRVTAAGVERQAGVFVSRLVPGGLAEGTGLLAVGDEVLEVNGIEVAGKTLDQVTDMMVANSSNLIITVKPANQRAVLGPSSTLGPTPVPAPRRASMSSGGHSHHSHPSSGEDPDDRFDQDEIVDLTGATLEDSGGADLGSENSLYHSSRRSLQSATDDSGQVLHL